MADLFGQLGFPCSQQDVSNRMESPGPIALVATLGDRLVGVLTVNVMHVLHRPYPVSRISALVINEANRGAGIGRCLVAAAEAHLASVGCELMELTSNLSRDRAHAFHRSLGYEVTSYRFKKDLGGASDDSSTPAPRPLAS